MGIQAAGLDIAADALASGVAQLSLHSTDGGTTGAGELAGGSYARQTPAYANTGTGTDDLTADVTFGGPGTATDANYLGFWTGDATPLWIGSSLLATPKTGLVDPDTLTVSSAPITATAA